MKFNVPARHNKFRRPVVNRVLEKTVKAAVKKRLKELGAYQFWPVQMGLGTTTLDCLGCWQGNFFSIETKAPGEKPTMTQNLTASAMRAAGGVVLIVDSEEKAMAITAAHLAGKAHL